MPALEQMDRYQKAVWWPEGATPDDYGQYQARSPIELSVRWVWTQTLMRDAQGNPVTVDATVVVDRKIAPGGTMWLGELADWYGTGSGSALTDDKVMQVVAYKETPDVKNRFVRRTLGLKYLKDTLPNSAG